MVIRRINPFSVGKVVGLLYAILGFIIGACVALIGLMGAASGALDDAGLGAVPGVLLAGGAMVMLPVLYGGLGFLMTAFIAWLYNLSAGMVGGIEIEVDER